MHACNNHVHTRKNTDTPGKHGPVKLHCVQFLCVSTETNKTVSGLSATAPIPKVFPSQCRLGRVMQCFCFYSKGLYISATLGLTCVFVKMACI